MVSGIVSHIRGHRWLWIAVFAVVAAVAWLVPVNKNSTDYVGDIMAVALMMAGMLLILQSQEGYVSPTAAAAEEA
jgi:hypothetical protein